MKKENRIENVIAFVCVALILTILCSRAIQMDGQIGFVFTAVSVAMGGICWGIRKGKAVREEIGKADVWIKYGQTTCIVFLSYLIMFEKHYASDSMYAIENSSIYGIGNLALGRYGCEVIYRILISLGINYDKCFAGIILFMILTLTYFAAEVSDNLVTRLGNRCTKKRAWIIKIAVVTLVCNCFMQEWFAFWECGFQWGFSILFMTWALIQLKEKMKAGNVVLSALFLILGLGFYQASLALYIVVGLAGVYISCDGELSKKSILKSALVIGIGGGASIVNLLSIRFFQYIGLVGTTVRTEVLSPEILLKNILFIGKLVVEMLIYTCGLYPKGLLITATALLAILVFMSIIRKHQKRWNRGIYVTGIWVVCLLSAFLPHLFTTSVWPAQRTVVGFWGSFSILLIAATILAERDGWMIRSALGIGIIILAVNIIFIQKIEMDLVISNRIDQEIAREIGQKIREYETETGNAVDTIAAGYDSNVTYRYGVTQYDWCDTNVSGLVKEWSDVNTINYYNGTHYVRGQMDEQIYSDYIRDKNWDYFNPDQQLIFRENVLYMIRY